MKKIIVVSALLLSSLAHADSEVQSASRASCQQSDYQPFEVSAGISTGDDSYDYYDQYSNQRTTNDETRLEFEFSYSFGGAKQIDCSRFQSLVEREQAAHTKQLELKVHQLEQQLLKQMRVSTVTQDKVKFK